MEVQQVLRMKGGEGEESYAHNSTLQRLGMLKVKHILEEAIEKLCTLDLPECINIADLGCSFGPNTFKQVEDIIDCIDKTCLKSKNKKCPSIQVFLNDLEGNDFNTVFKYLSGFYKTVAKLRDSVSDSSSCFVAATPGSFYCRLFPSNSMHFMNSSFSLHWLSQAPMNKGNIAKMSEAEVQKSYLDQFEKDFTNFLKLRSEEIVSKGHLLITMVAKVGDDGTDTKEVLGMILKDMVSEGLVEEAKLADFNLPMYNPTGEEVKEIIEKEGSFKIIKLETFKSRWSDMYNIGDNSKKSNYEDFVAKSIRAIFEEVVASRFGKAIMDDLFNRYAKKANEYKEAGKDMLPQVAVSLVKEGNSSVSQIQVL